MLPDGMSYRVLALPDSQTMTPQLLQEVVELVEAGATVFGQQPPVKSPSLENYPACDEEVKKLARELWGDRRQDSLGARLRQGPRRLGRDAGAGPCRVQGAGRFQPEGGLAGKLR